MRVIAIVLLTMLVWAQAAAAQVSDDAEIRKAFGQYDHGWRVYNADEVLGVIAPDFEWVNSVGIRITDKNTFRRLLNHLFADPDFRAGASGKLEIRSIRFPASDVAVVTSSEATEHQVDSATGKAVPVLHTNELTILQRRSGHWLIINDLTSDETHGI